MIFDPHIIWEYLFAQPILLGALTTLILSILAQGIGVILGCLMALGRRARGFYFFLPARLYIWFFRGTPVYVQLIFWFNFLPTLSPFSVALLALSLNEGAYMAEIVRAGIESVDRGQTEAAQSLGMTAGLAMRRIILPQALRVIIPPTGNEFISMLKTSSLASAISVAELLQSGQNIYTSAGGDTPGAGHIIELLIVVSLYYLVLTSIFSIGQAWLENRLGDRRATASPWTWSMLLPWRTSLGSVKR